MVSIGREPEEEASASVPIDPEAEQRELEAAGWERLDRQGKVFWRNPRSGHPYPQGVAVSMIRDDSEPGDTDADEGNEEPDE